MNPHLAHDLVAQHVLETKAAVNTARLSSALRAAQRSAAGPQVHHRRWVLRRA
jgi:hypothetical protein